MKEVTFPYAGYSQRQRQVNDVQLMVVRIFELVNLDFRGGSDWIVVGSDLVAGEVVRSLSEVDR
jgi:hypothetical protein